MKRGKISLSGSAPTFRVSVPGVDVDAAAPHQFVAHEDFLFSQPYAFGFVPCPFAGYTGNGTRDQSVTVTVPNVGVQPIIHLFLVDHTDAISYPAHYAEGGGSSESGYDVTNFFITGDYSNGKLTIRFLKSSSGRRSPNGCYYMLSRNADIGAAPGPGSNKPRMRIDKNGIKIARPGYDVDTAAEKDLYFSSSSIAARVFTTGSVTVSTFGHDRYRRARVDFPKTFVRPPLVFAGGLRSDGGLDVTPVRYTIISTDYARIHPHYRLLIDKTGFWIWVGMDYGGSFSVDVPTTWRYWVLENTLDD